MMQTRQAIPPVYYREGAVPPPPPGDPRRCEWPGEDGDGATVPFGSTLARIGLIYAVPFGLLILSILVGVLAFVAL